MICNPFVTNVIEKIHEFMFLMPLDAMGLAIDTMDTFGDCDDIFDCEIDVDGLIAKYPNLDMIADDEMLVLF